MKEEATSTDGMAACVCLCVRYSLSLEAGEKKEDSTTTTTTITTTTITTTTTTTAHYQRPPGLSREW